MQIAPTHGVADTGASLVSVMSGAPAKNIHIATKPIQISLPDRTKLKSTNLCDIHIPGLPHTLITHIVPDMKLASLLGIQVLCKAECTVIFDDEKCQVKFRGKTILMGYKDPTSNLWTLLIFNEEGPWTTPGSDSVSPHNAILQNGHLVFKLTPSQPSPCKGCAPQPPCPTQGCHILLPPDHQNECSEIHASKPMQPTNCISD
jgi:hypothetical protein